MALGVNVMRGLRTRIQGRAEHVRNFLSFIICRGVALALFAVSVPIFLASRGGADYGRIALLFTMFSYITLLDLGIGYAVNLRFTRALTRGRSDAHRIVATAVPIYLVAGVLICVLTMIVAPYLSEALFASQQEVASIRVLACTAIFLLMSAVLSGAMQAYNRVDLLNLSRTVLDVAKAVALIAAAQSAAPVTVAMWVVLAGTILKMVTDIFIVRWLIGSLRPLAPVVKLAEFRLNVRFGLPMAATSLVGILLMSADRVYVSRILGKEALTSYSIAADTCSKAFFLVAAVTGSLYTVLVRRNAAGLRSEGLQRASVAAVGVVTLVFYLPLIVFTPELLSFWIGAAAGDQVILVTRIWSLAAVAYLVLTVYYNYLQAAGKPGILFAAHVITATAMVGALVLMPQGFSIAGVAWIVCAAFAGESVALWAVSRVVAARGHRMLVGSDAN